MMLCLALVAVISTSLSPTLPASYRMEVRLDTSAHKIYGTERVVFLNPTPDTLGQICFHLYPNAFKDTSSIFARNDAHIRQQILAGDRSELIVSNVTLDGAAIDSGAMTETGTLLYLALPRPLPPGDSVVIGLDFELVIPRHLLRFGHNERGNYLISHWHPILAGYQNGRLIDNEYYPQSEFFSNFSNYDVRLEIPPEFAIGSTGELTLIEKDSIRAIYHARADSVIDFAFACGQAFEVFESDTLGINLRFMLEKGHERYSRAAENATKYSLAYCSEKLSKYPYKTFTLVDSYLGAQGMELPGMNVITFPSTKIRSRGEPVLWFVIAHEVAHEWYYATIATNEAEEPWLDEGLATYTASRILETLDDSLKSMSFFGYRVPLNALDRLFALFGKAEWPINLKSWDYPDDFAYSAAVYFRAAAALQSLEQMVGRAAFDSALGDYAGTYRFGHPTAADFQNSMETSLGIGLDLFFEQFVAGTARVDYAVRNLEYNSTANSDMSPDRNYRITVTAGREYEGVLPQKVEIGLKDGTVIDTLWDGAAKTAIFEFEAGAAPEHARVGYDGGPYALDENLANDSMHLKSFGARLLTFEWDAVFMLELLLTLLL